MLTRALGDTLGITRSATAPVAFKGREVVSWSGGAASALCARPAESGAFAGPGCEEGTAEPSPGVAEDSFDGEVGVCGNGEV